MNENPPLYHGISNEEQKKRYTNITCPICKSEDITEYETNMTDLIDARKHCRRCGYTWK